MTQNKRSERFNQSELTISHQPPPDRSEYLQTFFQNRSPFYNAHEVCRLLLWEHQIIMWTLVCFCPHLSWIFGWFTFCSTSLRQNINIFPKNFNINVIPCLLQLKPEAFRECRIDLVSLIVPLTPNLLDGMKVDGTSSVFPSVTGNSKNR